MYIKYRSESNVLHVKEVLNLSIRCMECEEENGSITHGAELYDASYSSASYFADICIQYAAGLLPDGLDSEEQARAERDRHLWSPTLVFRDSKDDDTSRLAWFNSEEAAERVLDKLCESLAAGMQFFDLTVYGEDGEEAFHG